jgi:CO dehydrogenase maturation factor
MPKSIAVAGKGGTGKSTIAAFLVLALKERGEGPILAVDADPDANLGTHLGLKVEQTVGDLREDILKRIHDFPPGMSKAQYMEAGLHEIIDESEGFDLLTMGRGEGSGCYCYLNSLIRKFSEDLLPSYRWLVMDNEAGLEHLSRRTTANIDVLIIVVNDNPVSLQTAHAIQSISSDLKNDIRQTYVVTNMVREERRDLLRRRIEETGLSHFCDIPFDPAVSDALFEGKSLAEIPDTPIRTCVEKIIDVIGGK